MKNICDWNNCMKIGEFRAPIEKDNSKNFRLLCLNHIKEFNKNWNYFAGMNDKQIYEFLKSLGIANKVTNPEELSQSLVEELKKNKEKNEDILKKIENYGSNTLNNVLKEIKIYINN